jgi:hypothetical protein
MRLKQAQFYEEAIAQAPVLCCHSMNLNVVPVKLIVIMNLLPVCFACLTLTTRVVEKRFWNDSNTEL